MKNLFFAFLRATVKPLIGTKISRYGIFRKPYQYIYNLLRPRGTVLRHIQGNQMYINTDDQGIAPSLLLTGVYEPYETQLFAQILKPGMVVFDIGANIGYYTLIAAKIVGASGLVYAFEPDPENYELLVKNIKLNGFTNVVPIPKALSNTSGKQRMYKDGNNWGMVSFSAKNVSTKSRAFDTETATLNEFEQTVSKLDIIKMDVEGAEGHVITGGQELLSKYAPVIFMEFIPASLKNTGTSPDELIESVANLGYTALLINEKDGCVIPISYSDLLSRFNDPILPIQSANIALHREHIAFDAAMLAGVQS